MTKIIALFLAVLMLCGLSAADAETEKEIPDVLGMTVGEVSLNFVENTEIVTYASDMYAFLLNLDGKYYRAIAFPDDDTAALYEAMKRFATNPEVVHSMASTARDNVADRYEQDYVRQCIKGFYHRVLQ